MFDSRLFLIGSGAFSLVVILYAGFMHTSLIVMSPDQSLLFFSRLFGNPAIIGLHVTVCILGPVPAVMFIVDAFRNSSISKRRRLLWVPATVIGYGLIFYWYFHILHRDHPEAPIKS
jgi:hypothetical protein